MSTRKTFGVSFLKLRCKTQILRYVYPKTSILNMKDCNLGVTEKKNGIGKS